VTIFEKLRHAWYQLKLAKKSAETAKRYSTDHSVVFGTAGFAIENVEKAMKLIEEVGKDLKR